MEKRFLYFIFAVDGFIFLRSGFEKVSGGKFVGGLQATLEKFADKNPYPFYKSFLQGVAIPNSGTFGVLTMYGELLSGLVLVLLSLYLMFRKPSRIIYLLVGFGFLVGLSLNLTFYFAAGHTSASTESVNLVMAAINLAGLIFHWSKLFSNSKIPS